MKTSSTLRGAVVGLSMSLTYCGSGLQRRSVHCQASTRLNASSSSPSSSSPSSPSPSPSPPTTTLKPFYSEVISSSSSGSQLSPLAYREDRYGGVVVERSGLATFNEDAIAFATSLESSLAHWKSLSRRGVWLSIPTEQAALVPAAVRSGFSFHHAEKEYVMLNKWLSETEENRMPPSASHQVGVGCVVRRGTRQLLMVQERSGPLKGTGVWKMPTGLVDAGEDVHAAAVREVLEETGVRTRFERILCFRQSHGAAFGKSDLFFVCLLSTKTEHETITPQEAEIEAADWVDVDEYMAQPLFQKSGVYNKINAIIRSCMEAGDQQAATGPVQLADAADVAVDAAAFVEQKEQSKREVEGMVLSRLPVGLRPGHNALYHFGQPVEPESEVEVEAEVVEERKKEAI